MLVPLIFQRAPYLTAALLTLSQPCLFSSPAAGGGGFPQLQPSMGVGQGWVTQRVSPSGTGAGSPVPAHDAHCLLRCSRAQPWSCKSLGSPWHRSWCQVGDGQSRSPRAAHCALAHHTPAHLAPCTGTARTGTSHTSTSHTMNRHIAHRADTPHI